MRTWLSPFLVCILSGAAAASPVVPTGDSVALVDHLDALADPAGTLSAAEVAARDLRPVTELDPGLGRWPGQPPTFVWLRFSAEIPAAGDWRLVIGRPYQPGTIFVDGVASPIGLGADGGSFRAELPPGPHQVLLRIEGPLTRPSVLHVATPAGEEALLARHLTAQGLYLGVMLAMLLMSLVLGVLLRDRAQLWYVGFLATSIAYFSLFTGTASRFLLPAMTVTGQYRLQNAVLALTTVAGIQFGRLFLDTARRAPRWDRVMRAFLALSGVVAVACVVGPDAFSTQAVALLGLLVPLVAIPAGVAALRAGSPWARFYLVGWSFFTLGGFLFAAPLPLGYLDGFQMFQLSSVLEAAAFTVALADRTRTELKHAEVKVSRAEKLAALGQLVAGVAHEVNNPNNFLTFNLPILEDYLGATRPFVEAADRGDVRLFGLTVDEFFADATTLVGNMKHGAERITGIVSQLKSYARPHDEDQWEEADVNRVVEGAAMLVRTPLRQWVATFELHLAETLPRVRMNPGRIEQVVINLVLNAGQAAKGRVDVRTRLHDRFVEIAVEDDGPGVPEAIRERIFEPFFTTKSGDQGTGMGLAISQRIVEEHGGTLTLASSTSGACFVVRLPVPPEQP